MLPLILIGAVALALYLRMEKRADEATGEPDAAPLAGESLPVYLTSYWPFQTGLSSVARLMEGGQNDRKGNPLYTLERHNAGDAPYVSLAGDFHIFPYGQRIIIPALGVRDDGSEIIARVVDTGGHFYGPHKVIRKPGYEPIDVCVETSSTAGTLGFGGPTGATVIAGDTL